MGAIADHFNKETDKIKEILPGVDNKMIGELMKLHDVGLTTVRIWAEQGALVVKDGVIYKMSAAGRTKEEIEIAINAIKKLSVFRCGAWFEFQHGSFSSDWTGALWILSFIDTTTNTAFLRKRQSDKIQRMDMETLYTAWLNQSAIIRDYGD